jgi:hypothetical protein
VLGRRASQWRRRRELALTRAVIGYDTPALGALLSDCVRRSLAAAPTTREFRVVLGAALALLRRMIPSHSLEHHSCSAAGATFWKRRQVRRVDENVDHRRVQTFLVRSSTVGDDEAPSTRERRSIERRSLDICPAS